jgi:serine/arginine repetitive matrix protein 2
MRALNGHADERPDFSSLKTPKPPGAWAATPEPTRFDAPGRFEPEAMSTPPSRPGPSAPDGPGEGHIAESGLVTPAPSLSRVAGASALPAQTPAPPGAWFMTPGTERRKHVQRVRFDMAESEASMAEDMPAELPTAAMIVPGALPQTPAPMVAAQSAVTSADFDSMESSVADAPTFLAHPGSAAPLRGPSAPITDHEASSTRQASTVRSQGSVRIVDAYGREQPLPSKVQDTSRSTVRIVDARGNVVEEETVDDESESTVEDMPMTREEALAALKAGVAGLAGDMDEPRLVLILISAQ